MLFFLHCGLIKETEKWWPVEKVGSWEDTEEMVAVLLAASSPMIVRIVMMTPIIRDKGDDYGVGGAHYDIFKMFESV